MLITTEDGRITGVRGDRDDPFSRGHICPKGPAMRELEEDPDRLRRPLRRTRDGRFEPVTWEEALDEVTTRIASLQKKHGRSSVATYSGNPTAHNHGALLMSQVFRAVLHTKNRFDANSQDANPKLYACHQMFGSLTSLTIPDVDRTSYFLVLGANPLASNGSIMTLGDVRGRLRAIRERGGRIVVLDPRRTETAEMADRHVFVRPGGDAAALLAILHVLFAEGLVDRAAVRAKARGLEDLERVARDFPPEAVAERTGITAETLREIAREFAAAPAAVAYGRVGVCLNELGSVASWLVEALNVVTGNFDRPGGAMFTKPAIDLAGLAKHLGVGGVSRYRSRVRGLPEVGGMLPASVMAEEMETEGEGRIRGLVTIAGNPVLSVPNGERLSRALAGLDFMVSLDLYVNETTRHAHFILPPRFALERSHYDLLFAALAVRNVTKYSEPVVEPDPDTKDDFTILRELSARLWAKRKLAGAPDLAQRAGERTVRGLLALLGDSPDRALDLLLRMGPYGDKLNPLSGGLNLAKVRAAPHGIDLGPLVPMARERVLTSDGRVDLAPAPLVADVARVSAWLARGAPRELLLIGRRHVRSNNSWMHNVPSLVKGPDRSMLLVHPDDAEARGLTDRMRVTVTSRVGSVEARVAVSDEVAPGVVSLPHGFGHAAARDTLRVAGSVEGPSMNAITDDELVEPLSGTAVLNGVPVRVERLAAPDASR
jgi:anaerobic selenocysteine-containing dehydrogenase